MRADLPMQRSENRILTTHTGSLPRPQSLVEMLGSLSRGAAVDQAALDAAAQEATNNVYRRSWTPEWT